MFRSVFRLFLLFGACIKVFGLDLSILTRGVCLNAANSPIQEQCCPFDPSQCDEALGTCIKNFKHPELESEDEQLYLSKILECSFIRRGYLKSENKINMKKVKADAKKIYHNDPTQKSFMISTYKYCNNMATRLVEASEYDAEMKKAMTRFDKPYVTLLQRCSLRQALDTCPFYHWQGHTANGSINCHKYAKQCRKIYFPKVKLIDWSSKDC